MTLNASNSGDDNGFAFLTWTQTSGPAVTLSNATGTHPSFVAPIVAADALLAFTLTITDDEGAVSGPDSVNVTVQPIPPTVTISGGVYYEAIPFGFLGEGLNYAGMGFTGLGAQVLVEVIDVATQSVIASGRFARDYQFTVPSQRDLALRTAAESSRQAPLPLPHWQIAVRDLDANGAPLGPIYSFTGPTFNSGVGGTRDLLIPSGWSPNGQVIGTRHAAPFAVLDAIQLGLAKIVDSVPSADFPPLTIDWGPDNPGGETFFTREAGGARRIVLSAEAGVDTDEYDVGIILHEFGHYIDDAFSRSDTLGGVHSFGDRLDMRVAFSEGLASAFAGIARNDPLIRDSFGTAAQGGEGFFSVEDDSTMGEGWYSESSNQEILWDLVDSTNDGGDPIALPFGQFWVVWQGPQRQTDALTSIFSFIAALKQQQPAEAAAIDTLLTGEQIVGANLDIYGGTESNDAGSNDVLPIYTSIALGGSAQLRSTNAFGTRNKLSNHRFLRLSLPAPTNVRFDLNAGAGRDPDMQIFRRGVPLAGDMGPSNESFTLNLAAGDYVLDVYDCGNVLCNPAVTAAPTDLTVAVTPN